MDVTVGAKLLTARWELSSQLGSSRGGKLTEHANLEGIFAHGLCADEINYLRGIAIFLRLYHAL